MIKLSEKNSTIDPHKRFQGIRMNSLVISSKKSAFWVSVLPAALLQTSSSSSDIFVDVVMGQNHVDTKTVIFLLMMARQDFLPPFWDVGFGESV